MGKNQWILIIAVMASIISLASCDNESSKQTAKMVTEMGGKKAGPLQKEKANPFVINVIDPTTNSVIKSFQPAELGYGRDDAAYKAEIEKWASELATGSKTAIGYDQRLIPDKIAANGEVIKGTPRSILEEDKLVERILQNSIRGGEVTLPLTITASGYKIDDVAHLDEVVVATYTTYFNSGVTGRTKNIELSAQALNNVILGTGDLFSFNTTLGPSDEIHGYQPAEEVLNGKLVMGIGGGICQTSSTLYNAIDALGVGYVEKHHHSLTVGYVPKGRDATVSYGGKDFRFENTTGVPLLIKAFIGKGSLTVEIRTSKLYEPLLKKGI